MRVSIPEHEELEAARKGLLLEMWADGDEFFGGAVEGCLPSKERSMSVGDSFRP